MTDEKLVFWPLLGLVLLSPLPFASVLAWSWAVMAATTGALLVLWIALVVIGRCDVAVSIRRIWLPALLFSAAALWIVVQLAPFTPSGWHHPIWQEAAAALDTPVSSRVSVNPYETGSALTRLLTYGAVFWLTLQYCRKRETALYVFYAITVAVLVYSVYGLMIEFSGLEMVLWVDKQAYRESLTSTFINRNSFATYAGLGLICATALINRRLSRLRMPDLSRREQLRLYLSKFAEREWVMFLVWLVIATALVLTDSRAGVLSGMLGVLFLVVLLYFARKRSTLGQKILTGAVAAAMAGILAISGEELGERLGRLGEGSALTRQALYSSALEAIGDSPVLGMGYGTYPDVYRLYRGEDSVFRVRADKAHSTYLENALEMGIPAAVTLFAVIGILTVVCLRGLRRRQRDTYFPATGAAATVLIGLHSIPDFSMQIPAVALTYCVLLAAACAQSWRTGA
ncbi:MAG: O-antigen ligase family protein [Alphaproteobacteria bacterium]|nr:O-antigen ligase family protein [Alphaproteobacteria bacterium]